MHLKFAVIGCGSIGRRHIGNLLQLGCEVVAYNRGAGRRNAAATDFGIETYADRDAMLQEAAGAVAVIASPNNCHVDDMRASVNAGCHLFVEKPIAVDEAGLSEIERLARRNGLFTHVGCNMRFHHGPSVLQSLLDEGRIGRPLTAQLWGGMYLPDWHPDEDHRTMYSARRALGGGAALDFIHEIDLALWMFGLPVRVAGMAGNTGHLEIETEEVADILLGYECGFNASIHVDYLEKPFRRGIRVLGEKGWLVWELSKGGVTLYSYETDQTTDFPEPGGYTKNAMYVAQLEYLIDRLKSGASSDCDFRAGWNALKVVNAAMRCTADLPQFEPCVGTG